MKTCCGDRLPVPDVQTLAVLSRGRLLGGVSEVAGERESTIAVFNGAAEPVVVLVGLLGRPASTGVLQPVPIQRTFHLVWFHALHVSLQVELRSWGRKREENGTQEVSVLSSLMVRVSPVTKNVMTCEFSGASPCLPNCSITSLVMCSISGTLSLLLSSRAS